MAWTTSRCIGHRPASGSCETRARCSLGFLATSRCAGDYNGDGTTDRAVYRPSTGIWFVQGQAAVQWGTSRRHPRRPATTTGTGRRTARCIGRRTASGSCTNQATVQWGVPGDIPVPGDYNGDGTTDRRRVSAVDRRVVRAEPGRGGSGAFPGDIPVPGDYNGDGTTDRAVFRPSTGEWFVQGQAAVQWGLHGDIPVPGDYNGDGTRIAPCIGRRPASGSCTIRPRCSGGSPAISRCRGQSCGVTSTGRHHGCRRVPRRLRRQRHDRHRGVSARRPARGTSVNQGRVQWGLAGDIPVPGDYTGDGVTDRAVFRPSTATWFVQGLAAGAVGALRRPPDARRLQRRRGDGHRGVSAVDRRSGGCRARPRCSGGSPATSPCPATTTARD